MFGESGYTLVICPLKIPCCLKNEAMRVPIGYGNILRQIWESAAPPPPQPPPTVAGGFASLLRLLSRHARCLPVRRRGLLPSLCFSTALAPASSPLLSSGVPLITFWLPVLVLLRFCFRLRPALALRSSHHSGSATHLLHTRTVADKSPVWSPQVAHLRSGYRTSSL